MGNILQTQLSDLNLIKGIKGKIEKRKGMTTTKDDRWRKKDGKEGGLQVGGRDWNPRFGYRLKRL